MLCRWQINSLSVTVVTHRATLRMSILAQARRTGEHTASGGLAVQTGPG